MGNGTYNNQLIPLQIGTGKNWKTASVAGGHSYIINYDGTLWACGENNDGELGDATNISKSTWVIINSCPSTFTTKSNSTNLFFKTNKQGISKLGWDFGDGTRSTLDSGNHIYSKSGIYNVCLISKCSSTDSSKTCQAITIKSTTCKSQFTSVVDPNDKFKFEFAITSPNSSFKYSWKFGDGNQTSTINPSHIYKETGTYNACLYSVDTATICSDSICQKIIIGNNGCDVTYITKSSADTFFYDYTGIGKSVKWIFGDDSISTAKKGVHIYKEYGGVYMCLKSYCSSSDSSQKCEYEYFCKAGYIKYLDPWQKYRIQLSNISKPWIWGTTYFWDFGDGGTSTQRSPTHKYTSFGKFRVCITVKIFGSISQFCDSLGLDSTGKMLKAESWELKVTDNDPPDVGINEIVNSNFNIYPNPDNL